MGRRRDRHRLHAPARKPAGSAILLDCGLYQGRRKEADRTNRHLPFPALSIDAVILSHAHIDHSGNLPTLVKNGFSGPIYTTPATIDLCNWMLRDTAHIQEKDAEFVNKRPTSASRGRRRTAPWSRSTPCRTPRRRIPLFQPCRTTPRRRSAPRLNYEATTPATSSARRSS